MRTSGFVVVGIAFISLSCSRPPPPGAVEALNGTLQAAVAGDSTKFIATLLPAARSSATSMRELPYFLGIKSFKVNPKGSSQLSASAVRLPVELRFGDSPGESAITMDFAMVRFEGRWYLDIYDTIRSARDKLGDQAFSVPQAAN